MDELITAIPTGVIAFVATNLDDLVILTLLFSQVNAAFSRWHIVFGQYLGFTTLVIASLCGFIGGLVLPQHLIGLLGLVPIAIGISRLLNSEKDKQDDVPTEVGLEPSYLASFLSPQAYGVAAITIANGSDNIGIYTPLFASSDLASLGVILGLFFLLMGVWCYLTYRLSRQPALAEVMTRYGNNFVPFVLIGLGVFIVLDSSALTPELLVVTSLCLIGLFRMKMRMPEIENN